MNKEEIARLMNDTAGQSFGTESHFQRFAAALVAAEREACAVLVETLLGESPELSEVYVAAEIRERGKE